MINVFAKLKARPFLGSLVIVTLFTITISLIEGTFGLANLSALLLDPGDEPICMDLAGTGTGFSLDSDFAFIPNTNRFIEVHSEELIEPENVIWVSLYEYDHYGNMQRITIAPAASIRTSGQPKITMINEEEFFVTWEYYDSTTFIPGKINGDLFQMGTMDVVGGYKRSNIIPLGEHRFAIVINNRYESEISELYIGRIESDDDIQLSWDIEADQIEYNGSTVNIGNSEGGLARLTNDSVLIGNLVYNSNNLGDPYEYHVIEAVIGVDDVTYAQFGTEFNYDGILDAAELFSQDPDSGYFVLDIKYGNPTRVFEFDRNGNWNQVLEVASQDLVTVYDPYIVLRNSVGTSVSVYDISQGLVGAQGGAFAAISENRIMTNYGGVTAISRCPECSNGYDDDGNGDIDYGEDNDCTSLDDDDEGETLPPLELQASYPENGSHTVNPTQQISFSFTQPMETPGTISVFGTQSRGLAEGDTHAFGYSTRFVPDNAFFPGEEVFVTSVGAESEIGAITNNYVFSYRTRVEEGVGTFDYVKTKDFGQASDDASDVALGDMNNDGYLDVVIGNNAEKSIVYFNNGNGGFTGGEEEFGDRDTYVQDVELGDMNNDGYLDIVAVGTATNYVYLNDGNGNMGDGIAFGPGNDWTHAVALGDLDDDGDLDIAVGNITGMAGTAYDYTYLNDGTGHMGDERWFGNDAHTEQLALADVDDDYDLDVITVTDGVVFVYPNDGTGNFGGIGASMSFGSNVAAFARGNLNTEHGYEFALARNTANYIQGLSMSFGSSDDNTGHIKIGDFNGDGMLDIATGNIGSENVIYLNSTQGFSEAFSTFGNDDENYIFDTGDIDNDGDLDIVMINSMGDGQQHTVYENRSINTALSIIETHPRNGSHTASMKTNIEFIYNMNLTNKGAFAVYSMQSGGRKVGTHTMSTNRSIFDATNDFLPGEEIHVTNFGAQAGVKTASAHTITFHVGSNPSAAEFQEGILIDDNIDARNVSIGDIDGDGDLDVLGTGWETNEVVWYSNDDGWGTSWTKNTIADGQTHAQWAILADIDSDHDLDVIASIHGLQDVVIWKNTNSDGSQWNRKIIDGNFQEASRIGVGDIDRDGNLDVIAMDNTAKFPGEIAWWSNVNGTGENWSTKIVIGNGLDNGAEIDIADIDGDGDLDVAGVEMGGNAAHWWSNDDGFGEQWTQHTIISSGYSAPYEMDAADIDNDGDLDLIGTTSIGLFWFENVHGNGLSWIQHSVGSNTSGASSAVGEDVDGDGNMDIVASVGNKIMWWSNANGDGSTWNAHEVESNFSGTRGVAVGDIDGDGLLDIVGAAEGANMFKWWTRANPNAYICQDGIDNDGDGLIDYGFDPEVNDPGCSSFDDETEYNPDGPECDDNKDNDDDGFIDFRIDTEDPTRDGGCMSPTDDSEVTQCSNGIDDDGDTHIDFGDPGCHFGGIVTNGGTYRPHWDNENLVLPRCGDGAIDENRGEDCDDGNTISNDGCSNQCISEGGPCLDDLDDDMDGNPDYPADLGCLAPTEQDEWQDAECADGIDNDGDGVIDDADFGCRIFFNGEIRPRPQCADGIDNDGDGYIDLDDLGCRNNQDHSEQVVQ